MTPALTAKVLDCLNGMAEVKRLERARIAMQSNYGVHTTSKGYLRIHSGPRRHRYHHRDVMAELAAHFCYYPCDERTGLPEGFHVHHSDHQRSHNCYQNLLLLQDVIHNHIHNPKTSATESEVPF